MAKSINELSIKKIETLYPDIIAYHCEETLKQGNRFELNPQTIKHYKFKARYIDELKTIIEQYNKQLTIDRIADN